MSVTLQSDPATEALRLVTGGTAAGLALRVMGGVGVSLVSPSASRPPLKREYGDIDLAGRSSQRREIEALLSELGYLPDEEINLLHGNERLIFWDPANGRQLDVLMDKLMMCHEIDFADGLASPGPTIDLADLLLSKLQVMETADKDFRDLVALIVDHPLGEGPDEISLARFERCVGADWGLWRTVSEVLGRTGQFSTELELGGSARSLLTERLERLRLALEHAPKTRRWKLRAKVGDRVRWYEQPDAAKSFLASAG